MQTFWYRNATGTAKNAHRRDLGTPAPNWPGPWDPSAKLARTPGPQHQIGPDPGPWGARVPERGAREERERAERCGHGVRQATDKDLAAELIRPTEAPAAAVGATTR